MDALVRSRRSQWTHRCVQNAPSGRIGASKAAPVDANGRAGASKSPPVDAQVRPKLSMDAQAGAPKALAQGRGMQSLLEGCIPPGGMRPPWRDASPLGGCIPPCSRRKSTHGVGGYKSELACRGEVPLVGEPPPPPNNPPFVFGPKSPNVAKFNNPPLPFEQKKNMPNHSQKPVF